MIRKAIVAATPRRPPVKHRRTRGPNTNAKQPMIAHQWASYKRSGIEVGQLKGSSNFDANLTPSTKLLGKYCTEKNLVRVSSKIIFCQGLRTAWKLVIGGVRNGMIESTFLFLHSTISGMIDYTIYLGKKNSHISPSKPTSRNSYKSIGPEIPNPFTSGMAPMWLQRNFGGAQLDQQQTLNLCSSIEGWLPDPVAPHGLQWCANCCWPSADKDSAPTQDSAPAPRSPESRLFPLSLPIRWEEAVVTSRKTEERRIFLRQGWVFRRFGQPNCQNQKVSVVSNILGCIILGVLLQFHLHIFEYSLSFLILIHKWDTDVYSIECIQWYVMICVQYLHPSPNISRIFVWEAPRKWIGDRSMSSNTSFLQLLLEVCISLQPRQIKWGA